MRMAQRNIDLPTVYRTSTWKGLDGNNFKILLEDPLKEAAEECEMLCEPLSLAFGPVGLGVMMADVTGLTISRIASQLLNVFDRGDSPIRDVLIKSALSLETGTGDGLKTYFILLTSFLKNIAHLHHNRSVIFNQIKRLQSAVHTVPNLHSKSAGINKIMTSFFYTRFTLPVAHILSKLFEKWIHLNQSIDKDIYTFLLDHFDALVHYKNNNFPLDESKIVEGVTVSGHYIGQFPEGIVKVVLKVVYFSEDNEDMVEVDVQLMNILKELGHTNHKELGILLVVNREIAAKGRQLLALRGVNVLMAAAADSTKLLSNYVMLHRARHNSEPVLGFSCDLLSYMTNITLHLPVFQLQIYAPSKTYMKAYSTSFRGCLRLCRFTLDTNSLIIPAGQFELLFSSYFASVFGSEAIIPVTDRKKLTLWFENKVEICEKLKSISITKEANNIEHLVINIVLYLKSLCFPLDNEVVSIICEAMMQVASKMPDRFVEIGYEPLSLKMTILQTSLTTLLMIMNTDKVLSCKTNIL